MSSRAEGKTDWEFDEPQVVGAVPKFIAEVRAAIVGVPTNPEDGSQDDDDRAAAFNCIADALKAFDEAVKDARG